MRIVYWQTTLMKYNYLFLLKIRKDVAKFVVCCSHDWHFKGYMQKNQFSPDHILKIGQVGISFKVLEL